MIQTEYVAWTAILFFAAASFFFALAESALFSLGKWRAARLEEVDPKRGRVLVSLLKNPEDLLATISLGNTFANAGILGTALWTALSGLWSVEIALIGVLLLILVGGEVLPKSLAVRSAEAWSLRLVRPMILLQALTAPLRQVAQRLDSFILRRAIPKSLQPQRPFTDEEYHELLEMAFQQGTLAAGEKEIILQIINLDRRTVKEVMKPRTQMICISDDMPVEEMVVAARRHKHRRLPLFDESTDSIVGLLNTHVLLLDPEHDVDDAIEMPSFVPETMNLLQLLKSLQRQHRTLAIVLDEFGGTAGLITMEDILEEVVGDLRREGEAEEDLLEPLGDGRWRVKGTVRLDDFRLQYPALPEIPEVETIGGLMLSELQVVPLKGQSVRIHGLRLTAQQVDERRVQELLVEKV